MNMSNTAKYKALALKLHAINDSDRDWILKNLNGEESRILKGYLQEIKNLNLSSDSIIISESLDANQNKPTTSAYANDDEMSEYIEQLNKYPSEKLITMLIEEDSSILAILQTIYTWRWQDDLLQKISPSKKMQINQYQKQNIAKVKPEVKLAILKIMAELAENDGVSTSNSNNNIEIKINNIDNRHSETYKKKRWWRLPWR